MSDVGMALPNWEAAGGGLPPLLRWRLGKNQ